MVVNADVDEIPASAAALVRSTRIAGNAVSDTLEMPELFDVDVNDLAWGSHAHSGVPARPAPDPAIALCAHRLNPAAIT